MAHSIDTSLLQVDCYVLTASPSFDAQYDKDPVYN